MKKYLFTFLAGLIGISSFGQTPTEDGKSLIEVYVSPLGYSLGAALNNGWYNTAKPHKLGGFDVTITANIVMIPEESKSFNISESNENTFSGGETPTILGDGDGSQVTYLGVTSPMPKGLNIPVIPLPMLQAGVGLIKGTELDFRYMPELAIGSAGKVGLFGVGLKHDILQWLPIVDKIPIDLSIQAGYTKLSSEIELIDPTPENIDPQANLDVSATTVNLILSKKLLMFTPYLGVGYNSTKTTFNVEGDYNIAGLAIDMSDLTKIDFENKGFRANIGFRFNITVLALQANYTFSEYPTATIGAGISLR
jgi:hypothetical protein